MQEDKELKWWTVGNDKERRCATMRVAVNICYKDRPTELGLLLQSLRIQTEQRFDIFILDDNSGTELNQYYFLGMLFNQLKMEGHRIIYEKTPFGYGVSKARQTLIDTSLNSKIYKYDYILRVDDDVILDRDYLERLLGVMEDGYDIASGVTPPLAPIFIRNSDKLEIANRVVMDKDHKIIWDGDDCGTKYTDEKTIPAHHFRSCALMKREVHEKVKYYPTSLSKHGFREETLFSYKALMEGFKIGVDLQAQALHLMTPSGGERFPDSQELMDINKKVLDKFVERNKKELKKHFPDEPKLTDLQLKKENNLAK